MKIIYLLIIMLTGSGYAAACDFCNCYLGLDPGYNKNTVGIRSNWRTSEWEPVSPAQRLTHGGDHVDGSGDGSLLQESFFTMELFVKYSPLPKLRVYLNVPYAVNTLEYEETAETRNAFSDMTLMAMYQLANTMPHDSASVRHRVFAGGGVKFPTGKSEGASDVEIPMSHHLYSGTGSTDYLLNVSYIGKFKKLGWNLDASYKMNGESCNDYRYGNTFNLTPRLFYEAAVKAVKLYPHAGAAYEYGVEDEWDNVTQDETGGQVWWASAGLDAYFGAFSVTTDFRLPVYQDMGTQMSDDKTWLFTALNIHF